MCTNLNLNVSKKRVGVNNLRNLNILKFRVDLWNVESLLHIIEMIQDMEF